MRTPNRQKQQERFLLERFLEAAELSAEIVDEREAPDFIVRFEARRIGIEITELFISPHKNSNPMQAQEAVLTKIVSRAQQIYQASGAPPAHVNVCFGSGCDLRQLNRDRAASELAGFVQRLNLSPWQTVDWRPEEADDLLPSEVSFIHALGIPSIDLAHWTVARAGWVAPLTVEALQPRIDEKSARLAEYQAAAAENWLVVVANATKPSQMFDVLAQLDPHEISSPFSRTFFYNYPGTAVIEFGTTTMPPNKPIEPTR